MTVDLDQELAAMVEVRLDLSTVDEKWAAQLHDCSDGSFDAVCRWFVAKWSDAGTPTADLLAGLTAMRLDRIRRQQACSPARASLALVR